MAEAEIPDTGAEDVHSTGQGFRAPRRLPVLFDS